MAEYSIKLLFALCVAIFPWPSYQHKKPCEKLIIRVFHEFDEMKSIRLYDSESENKKKTYIAYGDSVLFYCFGDEDKDKLSITWNGEKIRHRYYDFSIGWVHEKLDLQFGEYEYACNDEKGCQHSVIAVVTPGIQVESPNVQISYFYDDAMLNYTVQYGDPMTILCSGPDADRLVISKDGETLLTKRVSDTTISHFVKKPDLQISKYVCSANSFNTSAIIKVVPSIYFKTQNETVKPHFSKILHKYRASEVLQQYYVQYYDSMQVYCSGSRSVKLFSPGNNRIDTENINETTVRIIRELKLGKLELSCSDSEFPDYVNKIRVMVVPRIEVKSPNVRYYGKWIDDFSNRYTIKHGDSLETICYGPNDTVLTIEDSPSKLKIVNKTVVTFITEEQNIKVGMRHDCYTRDCSRHIYNDYGRRECSYSSYSQVFLNVLPVDVTDFKCISHDEKYLNCSWTANSDDFADVNFTLSEVDINNEITLICELPRSSRQSKFCVWDYEFEYDHNNKQTFSFQLQSCNLWVCSNQTLTVNHARVMKIAAPEVVSVFNVTQRGAKLQWSVTHLYRGGQHFDTNECDHKVEFWYSDILLAVNSSLVKCDKKYCNIELDLPCPDQFYKVKVYQKLKIAGEEYWSDPRTATFHTKPEKYSYVKQEECSWKPKKTPGVMKYFTQKLRLDVHLEMIKMKEDYIFLKDKLALLVSVKKQMEHK